MTLSTLTQQLDTLGFTGFKAALQRQSEDTNYAQRGVEQDYKKAYVLFKKAALAGNASAQFNLGALYDMGLGCEEDKEKAIEWCRKAAYQGHEMAKGIIKRMQNDGQIVF